MMHTNTFSIDSMSQPYGVNNMYSHAKMNSSASITSMNKASKQRKPNELFVGDLSYFCTEAHLFELFNQFGNVEGVRIVRNDQKKRSMNFGFVTMESPQIAREIAKVLNNHLFMGRIMKVELSDYKASPTSLDTSPGFQVHVSFSANFQDPDSIVVPNECFLRKAFIKFGTILDVVVREFNVNMNTHRYYGYAFVAFEREHSALTAIADTQESVFHGVLLRCTHSYRCLQSRANSRSSGGLAPHEDAYNQAGLHQQLQHGGAPSNQFSASKPMQSYPHSFAHQQHQQQQYTRAHDAVPQYSYAGGYPSLSSFSLSQSGIDSSHMFAHHSSPIGSSSAYPVSSSSLSLPLGMNSLSVSSSSYPSSRSGEDVLTGRASNPDIDSLVDELSGEPFFQPRARCGSNVSAQSQNVRGSVGQSALMELNHGDDYFAGAPGLMAHPNSK